jgi:HPt (histidine-containing phosphotransfer) domain-containing protein
LSSGDDQQQEQAAAIAKALDALWARFLPEIRERVSVLHRAAKALADGMLDDCQCAAAQAAAHKLAGTLGTFGLERGTELARELEDLYAQPGGLPQQTDAAKLAAAAEAIAAIVASRKTS